MRFKNNNLEQLRKTIELTHSKSGQNKTILPTDKHLYIVVTKVSHLTKQYLLEYIKKLISDNKLNKAEFEAINIAWMMNVSSYRLNLLQKVKETINLKLT